MRTLSKRKISFLPLLKRLLVGLLVIALFVVTGLVLWGFFNRQWDGKTRFTVITDTSPIQIKSFDPVSKQGIVLTLPDTLEIVSVGGRGTWQAGVVFQAGKKDWAADSIAHTLGISYTGTEFGSGWWDNWQWRKQTSGIDWNEVNLADRGLLDKITTPDGVELFQLTTRTDAALKDWFSDQAIAVESLGVVIVNTTAESGLGADAGRVVESMGLKVRGLTNESTVLKNCIVRGTSALKKSVGGQKLRRVFDCAWEETNDEDLMLLLGTDYVVYKKGE